MTLGTIECTVLSCFFFKQRILKKISVLQCFYGRVYLPFFKRQQMYPVRKVKIKNDSEKMSSLLVIT